MFYNMFRFKILYISIIGCALAFIIQGFSKKKVLIIWQ